jgi:hypothetical protein
VFTGRFRFGRLRTCSSGIRTDANQHRRADTRAGPSCLSCRSSASDLSGRLAAAPWFSAVAASAGWLGSAPSAATCRRRDFDTGKRSRSIRAISEEPDQGGAFFIGQIECGHAGDDSMVGMTEIIEVTYRRADGRYLFTSADRKFHISHADARGAVTLFAFLISAKRSREIFYRIEAYEPLGRGVKTLRDAGAIVRFRLGELPPPLPPWPWQMPGTETLSASPPMYASWHDYLARTSPAERMSRCAQRAQKANRKRLLSDAPEVRLTTADVWAVLEAARGRCAHCGSLAVEARPSNPLTGAPIPWAQVGRRIGSLQHVKSRLSGGDNNLSNLAWSCLWCNTWRNERRPLATDHGGHYPED